ncbi:natural killer cells antigen CD94-like isoform X1 [Manis pentadactyla]|uniref:natural killer cells antigen CD94-like isoform X1 n=1 Tax=Manis pentadactyla TaxID=143292 RepID=UPI00255CE167|nr:natural killer cells antigen CD94-like isoform X1 [Manis pentadactyla]XP_057347243.1 natural killer cells antigen CD94-like isoform X1 [Manis pentadactyla]
MAASQSTPWKLISGVLGVMCLLLMSTLAILLRNSFTKKSIQPALSPGSTIGLQGGSGCCSCHEKWIGYQCNCYFISNELKSWAESRNFCSSQNSSLLQMQNEDELHFMNSSKYFYWIGLHYSEEQSVWVWENGSALSRDLSPLFRTVNTKNCITYSASKNVLGEPCKKEHRFICKQQLFKDVSRSEKGAMKVQ